MSAALLWAEQEGWLPSDQPASDRWLMRGQRRHAEAAKQQAIIGTSFLMNRHLLPGLGPDKNLAMPIRAEVRALPEKRPLQGKARPSLLALIVSVLLHGSIGLAAAMLISKSENLAEHGGAPDHLDVLVLGEEEAAALLEGAKPQPASLVAVPPVIKEEMEPEAITPPPALPSAAAIDLPIPVIPLPDWSVVPGVILPEPIIPPQPAPAVKTDPAPLLPPPAVIRPPRAAERKPVQSPVRPAKTRTEAQGKAGEGAAVVNRVASQRGGTGGQAPVAGTAAITSYRNRLVAHLTRYKSYPEQAQDRGIGGRNAVTITLSREGRVLSAALANTSGHSILDSATLVAARRAQPFPAIPEGGPGTFTVTIGLHYDLR